MSIHLHMVYGYCQAVMVELSGCDRLYGPQILTYLLTGFLRKEKKKSAYPGIIVSKLSKNEL